VPMRAPIHHPSAAAVPYIAIWVVAIRRYFKIITPVAVGYPLPAAGIPEITYGSARGAILHLEERFPVGIIQQPRSARHIVAKRDGPFHLPVGMVGGKFSLFFTAGVLTP